MLDRVIDNLRSRGFDTLTVNVHHFASQITDFLSSRYPEADIAVSDESERLLDTGGALLHAAPHLRRSDIAGGVLVHNVDILSSAPLENLMQAHRESGADMTLMVSSRESSRALLWDEDSQLRGWRNNASGQTRLRSAGTLGDMPSASADPASSLPLRPYAFSGIYVFGPRVLEEMERRHTPDTPFSIIDFMLDEAPGLDIRACLIETPDLIDIGKPDTLRRANLSFGSGTVSI